MNNVRLIPADAAWPFKDMAVGDIAICLRPNAALRAHTYGYATRKRFMTRTVTSKKGEKAIRVTRLPDDAPKVEGMVRHHGGGRERTVWPFESLGLGHSWVCNKFDDIPKVLGAVQRANRKHKADYGKNKYNTRLLKNKQLVYVSITVVRCA